MSRIVKFASIIAVLGLLLVMLPVSIDNTTSQDTSPFAQFVADHQPTASADSGGATVTRVPLTDVYGSCSGETVISVSGFNQISTNTTFDSAGGVHGTYHFLIQGKGTGSISGDTYTIMTEFGNNYTLAAGGTYTSGFQETFLLNAQGKGNKLKALVTGQVVIDANGNVRVDNFRLTVGCAY